MSTTTVDNGKSRNNLGNELINRFYVMCSEVDATPTEFLFALSRELLALKQEEDFDLDKLSKKLEDVIPQKISLSLARRLLAIANGLSDYQCQPSAEHRSLFWEQQQQEIAGVYGLLRSCLPELIQHGYNVEGVSDIFEIEFIPDNYLAKCFARKLLASRSEPFTRLIESFHNHAQLTLLVEPAVKARIENDSAIIEQKILELRGTELSNIERLLQLYEFASLQRAIQNFCAGFLCRKIEQLIDETSLNPRLYRSTNEYAFLNQLKNDPMPEISTSQLLPTDSLGSQLLKMLHTYQYEDIYIRKVKKVIKGLCGYALNHPQDLVTSKTEHEITKIMELAKNSLLERHRPPVLRLYKLYQQIVRNTGTNNELLEVRENLEKILFGSSLSEELCSYLLENFSKSDYYQLIYSASLPANRSDMEIKDLINKIPSKFVEEKLKTARSRASWLARLSAWVRGLERQKSDLKSSLQNDGYEVEDRPLAKSSTEPPLEQHPRTLVPA